MLIDGEAVFMVGQVNRGVRGYIGTQALSPQFFLRLKHSKNKVYSKLKTLLNLLVDKPGIIIFTWSDMI